MAVVVSLLAFVCANGMGCNESDRRLSEKETLDYKRELIAEDPQALSDFQKDKLGQHMGRTKGQIDAYFDDLKAEHAREIRSDRAQFETQLRGASPGSR